jgi:elongation factor 1-gamma
MALLTLATPHPENERRNKILVAAAFAGVAIEADATFNPAEASVCKDFLLNCHPIGRNPVLRTDEGPIFETNSILRHIARLDLTGKLYGTTPYLHSQVDMWLDFSLSEIDPIFGPFLGGLFSGVPPPNVDELKAKSTEVFHGLNTWLENRTFLVGDRLTVADISIAFALTWFFRYAPFGKEFFDTYTNVRRLYNTVMKNPTTVGVFNRIGGTYYN